MTMRQKARKSIQWGLERAKREGLRVIEPKHNELQIDLDNAKSILDYASAWFILQRNGIINRKWRARFMPSKKRGHAHVIVTMPKNWRIQFLRAIPIAGQSWDTYTVELLVKVGLQAILGSDRKREAFNLCRVVNGNKYPIALFRKDGETCKK